MTRVIRLPGALAATVAAALVAGCAAQPIGTFDRAATTSEASQAQTDLYFRPGETALLPGEADRVNRLLRSLLLRPDDDVILTFGSTGSDVLDARRIAEARRALATRPARLRIVAPIGFARAPDQPDIALVQVKRYDQVLVTCPGSGRTNENRALLTPVPVEGCANAVNVAIMAADARDLTAPRRLEGSDAFTSALAVERYRVGDVTIAPLDTMSGGN